MNSRVSARRMALGAAALLLAAMPSPSAAISSCKAKINSSNGVILVEGKDVLGTLTWGPAAGNELYPLLNPTGDCGTPGDDTPKKCQLGATGTPESISPPEGCTVYLRDSGDSSTCAAYVKKCIPGRRPCPSDMVSLGGFCIDKYEASVWSTPTGGTQYGSASNDYPCLPGGGNCTGIYARSVAGVPPSTYISWFQAQRACSNVGKRLPTVGEWQQAVAGSPDPGPNNGTTDCNSSGGVKANTGSRSSCVSTAGAFDMVANADELVDSWLPFSTGCGTWSGSSNDAMCIAGASTTLGPGVVSLGGAYIDGILAGPKSVYAQVFAFNNAHFLGFRCAR